MSWDRIIAYAYAFIVVFLILSGAWLLRVAAGSFRRHEEPLPAWGLVLSSATCAGWACFFAWGLVRRVAELRGVDATWMLAAPVQLAFTLFAAGITAAWLALFGRSMWLPLVAALAAAAVAAWLGGVSTAAWWIYRLMDSSAP